jgi:ABC-type transporter Mla subunit MlaD
MREEELKDLVVAHDKHIDLMAQSIENLASAVGATSSKLDDIIGVITQQNVLMEKFHNLEDNLKESFDRVHSKVRAIEENQEGSGCSALKVLASKDAALIARLKKLESSQLWITRLVIGALITGVISMEVTRLWQ